MPEKSASEACPRCGRAPPADAPCGLCTKCLLADVLGADSLDLPIGDAGSGSTLPRMFGGYELIEELARGGMGIVYRARQTQINRWVAMKVLAAGQFASPDFVQRFRTETEAAASLDHPNIIPIYEVGENDGLPFFSMKLVEGGSLAKWIAESQPPISTRQATAIVSKLARAVHYAHQRGILHRDIKPGNVLIDADGEPHLTDFGLAKLIEKDSTLTRTMAMLGTPSYMSPEQARGEAKQLTTGVDVYGLGAVFYELLAGTPPFAGGTTVETVRLVLEQDPRRPSALRPNVDRDLETICLKCLEKDPDRRYLSADSLAADLDRWREHKPILARPVSPLERFAKWIRRHQIGFIAIVTIALLVLAGGAVSTWQAVRATQAEALAQQRLSESRQNERRALEARQEADASADARRRELIRLHVATGNRMVESGDAFLGLLQFAEALRLEAGDAGREDVHRRRIAAILNTSPRVQQFWRTTGGFATARFHPDGSRIVYRDDDGKPRIFEVETGGPTGPIIPTKRSVTWSWFTPDGAYLATVNHDGTLQHWDLQTGASLGPLLPTRIKSPAGRLYKYAVDYSPDGRRVIALVTGGVQIFALPSGKPEGPLLATTDGATGVRFSPDGQSASICGENPALQLVEVPSGRPIWTLSEPLQHVGFAVFSPDGRRITTTSGAHWQQHDIWDPVRGERVGKTIEGFGHSRDLHFTADGRWIALGGWSEAQVVDARTGRAVSERMKHGSQITHFELSPDGRRLATASYDRTARVWESATGRLLLPALHHAAMVTEARFSPDGRRLLTVCEDNTARLWELPGSTGERLVLNRPLLRNPQVRLSPDGHHLLVFAGPIIEVWDNRTGRLSLTWTEASATTEARFFPDGIRVAIATTNGTVHVRDCETAEEVFRVAHAATVRSLNLSPDGKRMLTAGDDGTVQIWDSQDGTPVMPALEHEGPVRFASFSPDGRKVLTGGSDKTLRVWDATNGTPIGEPIALRSPVMSAALSADGNRILIVRDHVEGRETGATQLWDPRSQSALAPERGLKGPGRYSAVFSPDGRRHLMLEDATSVAICDSETGQRSAPRLEHKHLPTAFAFSPDGRLVLTCADQFARVWDAATGEPVSPTLPHGSNIVWADWNPNGREIVTCVYGGKIFLWDISPASESVQALTRLAELMAAHRLDARIGIVPLTPAEMKTRWQEQRK